MNVQYSGVSRRKEGTDFRLKVVPSSIIHYDAAPQIEIGAILGSLLLHVLPNIDDYSSINNGQLQDNGVQCILPDHCDLSVQPLMTRQ